MCWSATPEHGAFPRVCRETQCHSAEENWFSSPRRYPFQIASWLQMDPSVHLKQSAIILVRRKVTLQYSLAGKQENLGTLLESYMRKSKVIYWEGFLIPPRILYILPLRLKNQVQYTGMHCFLWSRSHLHWTHESPESACLLDVSIMLLKADREMSHTLQALALVKPTDLSSIPGAPGKVDEGENQIHRDFHLCTGMSAYTLNNNNFLKFIN